MKYLLISALLAASPLVAHAELFSFYAITSNDSSGHAQFVGESQLHMDATLSGLGQISFLFTNTGTDEIVISKIYFDFAPELNLGLCTINDGNGVEFQTGSTPNNLPAGRDMENVFLSNLGFSAKNPVPHKGINPSESLELILCYDDSYDLFDALGSEDLRVGLHAQGFEGGYSESFVNVIPEPATMPLIFIGSFFLHWVRIKRTKKGKQPKCTAFTPHFAEGGTDELHWKEIQTHRDRNKPISSYESAIRRVT